MKKALKIVAVLFVVAFVVIQFIRPTFSNPEIVAGQPIEESGNVPPEVAATLARSCNDCHSNRTAYPWYSRISPASWFMAGHIEEGRRELNFSEWGTYPARRKKRKLEEICEMVESGTMPLGSYTLIHREAVLTAEQSKAICEWTKQEISKLPAE